MSDELQPVDPNAGEIDVLSALWEAMEEGQQALKLSEVRERVTKRRAEFGEPPPALTTISTYLRSALSKRLLEEVRKGEGNTAIPLSAVRTRGALASSRSPQTAYRTIHEPGKVFANTFHGLVWAYPKERRLEAISDFAEAADLKAEDASQRRDLFSKLAKLLGLDQDKPTERAETLFAVADKLGLPKATLEKLEALLEVKPTEQEGQSASAARRRGK